MISSLLLLISAPAMSAPGATLPGVPLPFEVNAEGGWILPAELPPAFAAAGVKPGWQLATVDGLKLAEAGPLAAQQLVASGQARPVRLSFLAPEGEVVVVVPRVPLVVVEEIGLLPWPEGFKAEGAAWRAGGDGAPLLLDAEGGRWSLEEATGAQQRIAAPGGGSAKDSAGDSYNVPEVWWSLAAAGWAVTAPDAVLTGDRAWATGALSGAARLRSFQGRAGDHLAIPQADGLRILAVNWPQGTPALPFCSPEVPETCLVAGRQIVSQLLDRPGGQAEALRVFGVACEGGSYRACLEAVALEDVRLSDRALACGERDVNACHSVAAARMLEEGENPSPLLMGVLEYACAVDASGSLGERLRRLEDVGEGCMMLSRAFDQLNIQDRALLSLDQACILGRADACGQATRRREDAFALRTVRECESEELPLSTACVQLGRLLDAGPIRATKLDSFDAFLRACRLGDEEGCTLLGDYVDRWGINHRRVIDAEKTLLASCTGGEQRACVGAAHLLVRHDPRSEAYGQALTLFDAACTDGIATACIAGAGQRRIGSARKVEARDPLSMWDAACDKESPAGCAGYGERLARSKKTWEDAYIALTRACDTGEAGACTYLGRFITSRHKDPWEGEQMPQAYLQRGCTNGDAEGCYWLAEENLPKKGDPAEQDYLLLARACEGDFGQACADLARVHLQRATNFDEEIAAGHLENACDNGHFESCRDLSTMYLQGKGVEADPEKARELAQRYRTNAERRLLRLGIKIGFPSLAGGEGEFVLPIPVGPALSLVGSYSWLPEVGGFMTVLKGDDWQGMDYRYVDAGVRLYPNNKARGLYGMVAWHELQGVGYIPGSPFVRSGISGRIGIYSETKSVFTRVEMGIGQYGLVDLHDFDEDQDSKFPLIQATLAFTFGFTVL